MCSPDEDICRMAAMLNQIVISSFHTSGVNVIDLIWLLSQVNFCSSCWRRVLLRRGHYFAELSNSELLRKENMVERDQRQWILYSDQRQSYWNQAISAIILIT